MKQNLNGIRLTDKNVKERLSRIFSFDEFDIYKEFDLDIVFYNKDLHYDSVNPQVAFIIKAEHLRFIREVRRFFEEHNIKINYLMLIGTTTDLNVDEMTFELQLSKYQDYKKNDIIPSREVFMYEDTKKELDFMLQNKQISEEEYQFNMGVLQEELNISNAEDEVRYIN